MSNIHVVSRDRHAKKYWQRYRSYAHAALDPVAPLVLRELSRACTAMPIGFIELKGELLPVAIQGMEPGKNLFLDPDRGWLADYIPAAYRSHPFVLGTTSDGDPVLCVMEDSGLLSEMDGEPFFDDDGQFAPRLREVFDFMIEISHQRSATRRICAELKKHELIQPWPIKRLTDAGAQFIRGLYRIDRAAVHALPAQAFQDLRLAGALPVIYCHLISLQHMPRLASLALAQEGGADASQLVSEGELDIEFLNHGGTVSFGSLGQPFMQDQGERS